MNRVSHPGPFLFDTSAESRLAKRGDAAGGWLTEYSARHPVYISSVTLLEHVRGYAVLRNRSDPARRAEIEAARVAYLQAPRRIVPVDAAVAIVAGEIMASLPDPPSPPIRAHRLAEKRASRLARWRFDVLIAATALVARMPLVHDNPADFEAIRSSVELAPERFPGLGPLELLSCRELT